MIGMKRLRFPLLLNLPLAVLNLAGSILLVGYTPLGVLGVLIPTVIVFAIRRICETVFVARITGVGVVRYLRESYLRPTLLLCLLAGPAVALKFAIQPRSLPPLLGCATLIIVTWAGLCWLIGLSDEDRRSFAALFRRVGAACKKLLRP